MAKGHHFCASVKGEIDGVAFENHFKYMTSAIKDVQRLPRATLTNLETMCEYQWDGRSFYPSLPPGTR